MFARITLPSSHDEELSASVIAITDGVLPFVETDQDCFRLALWGCACFLFGGFCALATNPSD